MTQSEMTVGPTLSLLTTHLVCVLSLQAVLVVTQVQAEVLLIHVVHCDGLVISSLCVPLVIITGHQDTAVCTAAPALITALPRPGIVTLRLGEKIVRQDQHCSAPLQLSACRPSQHVSTHSALTYRFLIICILSGLSPVPIGLALDIEMSCRLQHCSCHSWTALGTPGDCRQSTN